MYLIINIKKKKRFLYQCHIKINFDKILIKLKILSTIWENVKKLYFIVLSEVKNKRNIS